MINCFQFTFNNLLFFIFSQFIIVAIFLQLKRELIKIHLADEISFCLLFVILYFKNGKRSKLFLILSFWPWFMSLRIHYCFVVIYLSAERNYTPVYVNFYLIHHFKYWREKEMNSLRINEISNFCKILCFDVMKI